MENTGLQNKTSDVKIAQALELLNEAAKEKKTEVIELFRDKYSHIKQAIEEGTVKGQEKIKETAIEVDKRVRENPWPYIGGVAVVAVFVGFLMGSKRK